MPEEKVRVNAYITTELYAKLTKSGLNKTEAITKGLELVLSQGDSNKDTLEKSDNGLETELRDRIRSLEDQLKVKDNINSERIVDLKDQLKIKDQQLEKKDTQIENLTNTMQSQAINIHEMLNQRQIEAPGAKKPWWKFW